MYTLETDTLPNGLRVILVHLPSTHAAVMACFVKAGPRYEGPEEAGLSHFVEHMLFKGTESHPDSRALAAAFEDLGGEYNGFTEREYTSFLARVHRDHVRRGIGIFSEMFRAPRFAEADVEMEKRIVEQEIGGYGGAEARFPLDELLWPGMRGRWLLIGSPERVRRYTRAEVLAFFQRFYRPRNMALVIAGAFDPAEVRDATAAGFAGLKDGAVDLPVLDDAPARGPRYAHTPGHGPQCGACVAFVAPSYLHPDLTAVLVIDAILGLGTTSRLFRGIRERRGLAYDISSAAAFYSDRGLLSVAFGTERRRLVEGIRAVLEELALLRDQGVAPEELQRIQERVRCEMEYKLDEPDEMASWFGSQALLLPPGQQRRPEEQLARVRQVTAGDVRRVLGTLFASERRYVVTEGPVPAWLRLRVAGVAMEA